MALPIYGHDGAPDGPQGGAPPGPFGHHGRGAQRAGGRRRRHDHRDLHRRRRAGFMAE